jgi:hypothetical protein
MKAILNKEKKSSFPSLVHPVLLLDDSAGKLDRELWWMNEFSC